ncbi:hypothetical protein KO493_12340 [Tamlana agarivorans]|uniref:Uncharacterized protein n=1 Tax=Pseudotamlana agarivorans TaxID=481183 RepID=A0ACC5UAY6_9FLAO|nr:hypothetical protein [Tamlana agarivorans]MBU2951486.1 hypothetical protein [Tamlana agarivorans]
MNKLNIYKIITVLCFMTTANFYAQQKLTKVKQSIDVDKEVKIDLNTSHCNIVFDTWNKDVVEIEAYINGEQLTKEELKNALDTWDINVNASMQEVMIASKANHKNVWVYNTGGDYDDEAVHAIIEELKFELAEVPEMDLDLHLELPQPPIPPDLPKLPKFPKLPKLPKNIGAVKFDYKAYKKEGDAYMAKYAKEIESQYGDDFAKNMASWGEAFEKQWEDSKYAEKMEAWGERYAERMEAHAERMEAHAEHMEEQANKHKNEAEMLKNEPCKIIIKNKDNRDKNKAERVILIQNRQKKIEELVKGYSNSKAVKTIKIKIPKHAKLKVNVKYGAIEFASNVENIDANLEYAKLQAERINGGFTSINASYSPLSIKHWNTGVLNLNYVEDARIETVNQLTLNAVSSHVEIDELLKTAVINGNIGNLNILKINDKFSNLNVNLQNSNAVINLPDTDVNLQYTGTRSQFKHPGKASKEQVSSFSSGNGNSDKSITVNAKFSSVTIK